MLKEKCKVISNASILVDIKVISYLHSVTLIDDRRWTDWEFEIIFNKQLLN